MRKKGTVLMTGFVCMAAMIVGCSGGDAGMQQRAPSADGKDEKPMARIDQIDSSKPITLKVWTGDNDDLWRDTVEGPIKKKFPNITLERLPIQQYTLEKLIASGNPPDIIKGSKNHMIFQVKPAKMEYDLSELIKKYNVDLGRYIPDLIQSIKGFGDKGEIYGLPNTKAMYATIYNKRLFDKFAVPYPKDGMTWDEAIELAKRMTRTEDAIQYRGLILNYYNIIGSQLNMVVVDRGGKASMSNWPKPAAVFKQIYDVTGNKGPVPGNIAQTMQPFYKETMAMVVINPDTMFAAAKQYPDLQWDLVTAPGFPEAPNTDPYMNYTFLAISPTSQYKEEAFKVIAYLNSDEVQTERVRKGYPTILNNPEIQKQFAAELPELKGKNLQASFKNKQSDPYVNPYFDTSIDTIVKNGFNEIVKGDKDINTILRQLDEAIDKRVAELKR